MLYEEWESIDKESYKFPLSQDVCPFLVKNKCSIYEHRPLQCRWHGLSEDGLAYCDSCVVPEKFTVTEIEDMRREWTLALYREIGEVMASKRLDRIEWFKYCMNTSVGQQIQTKIKERYNLR